MRGLLQDYSSKLSPGRLNLAPLIDVVFQLILFFLVTSSFIWYSGMQVKVPKASSALIDRPLEAITLEIMRSESPAQPERLIVRWWEQGVEGEVLWPTKEGEDPMSGLTALSAKLKEHKESLPADRTPSIVIAAEDSVPYQGVITVIDMCQQIGLSDIVLAVQRVSGQVPTSYRPDAR